MCQHSSIQPESWAKQAALEATQGQIPSQSPTDAASGGVAFEWELTEETIFLPLGCLQGGEAYDSVGRGEADLVPVLELGVRGRAVG